MHKMPVAHVLGAVWGPRLKAARKAAGKSQTVLAYESGVGQQQVSRWEAGLSIPRDGTRIRLGQLLGIPAHELFPYPDVPDNGEAA